eukprot:CAMPEP_0116870486 /NCGR_PEP_ID=MMETSP0463-20121206/400_1 /TAXON_ID=181622 /ORGANISM="Strombidinopsis sp, Strain SopsisLIS2011" /LENGTH=42 /DNA_ID= /DNA_START= /DNA_END= /DNA_ORIENTATION=
MDFMNNRQENDYDSEEEDTVAQQAALAQAKYGNMTAKGPAVN